MPAQGDLAGGFQSFGRGLNIVQRHVAVSHGENRAKLASIALWIIFKRALSQGQLSARVAGRVRGHGQAAAPR